MPAECELINKHYYREVHMQYYQDLTNMLKQRKMQLEQRIGETKRALRAAPSGSLRVSGPRGSARYYCYQGSEMKQQYIRDRVRAQKLAQKNYDQRILRASEKELRLVDEMLRSYPKHLGEDVFEDLSRERQELIKPILETDEEFVQHWLSVRYEGKTFQDNSTAYITDRNERVRSKSELLLANLLNKKGIPYRYEYPLTLKGIGTIFPDFCILNVRLRKEYIHEHFGMMDDPEYAGKAVGKLNLYMLNGYYPGERLIITSETRNHQLDMKCLNQIIDKYYL